jgi:hypothetical protein
MDPMARIMAGIKCFPFVQWLEDSGIQWYGGFKWRVPEGDLPLGYGGVEIEESDECAFAHVSHVPDLQFTSFMQLGVPEGVSLVKSRETRRVDNIGSV